MLYRVQQSGPGHVIAQDSLLWGHEGKKSKAQWGKAFWVKIIGPFDLTSFKKTRHFWEFWLGEKCQAMGFLWRMVRRRKAVESVARGENTACGRKEG